MPASTTRLTDHPTTKTLAQLRYPVHAINLFAKTKHPGWCALSEIGGELVIAQVRRNTGDKASLLRLERVPAPDPASPNFLRELRKSHDLGRARCATFLPLGSYRFHQAETPAVPDAELSEALRWKIKDQLDYPVEDAAIQALPIPSANMPGRPAMAYAIAAHKKAVRELVQHYQNANLALDVIDVIELAQRNLAALFEEPGRGLAMLSITAAGGLLTITCDGELYALRQIDLRLAELSAAENTLRTSLLDRLVLELQRSLDNFDRQHGQIPVSRLMLLPMPGEDDIKRYLVDNLYLPVASARLDEVLDVAATPGFENLETQNQGLFAIGLALREADR